VSAKAASTGPTPPLATHVVGVVAVLVAFAASFPARLNGDVTYAFGTLETTAGQGISTVDLFMARPLPYRLLIQGMDAVRGLVTPVANGGLAQAIVRAEAGVLVAIAGLLLFAGLRRHLDASRAALVSGAVTAAGVVAPPWNFLEPDWVAGVIAVAGVGVGLIPRRRWVGAVLAGLLFMLVVAMKAPAAPLVIAGVLALWIADRRLAVGAAVATAVWGAGWLALNVVAFPWEITWTVDQGHLPRQSPLSHGLRLSDLHHWATFVANNAVLVPLIATVPLALVGLASASGRSTGRRVEFALCGLASVVASALPGYLQGEEFMYHYSSLPLAAAAVWGLALIVRPNIAPALSVATAAVAVAGGVLLAQPLAWRRGHLSVAIGAIGVIVLLGLLLFALTARRPAARGWLVAAPVALAASLAVANLPTSSYSFDVMNAQIGAVPNPAGVRASEAQYTQLRGRIGARTDVLYLTFGSINYALGNPTTCRYPSPQWLQRATVYPAVVVPTRSYADSMRCLTDADGARYLIWDTGWIPPHRLPAEARTAIDRAFDCTSAALVPAPGKLVVCPRRGDA
jgi:hypothetical protein